MPDLLQSGSAAATTRNACLVHTMQWRMPGARSVAWFGAYIVCIAVGMPDPKRVSLFLPQPYNVHSNVYQSLRPLHVLSVCRDSVSDDAKCPSGKLPASHSMTSDFREYFDYMFCYEIAQNDLLV